MNVSGMGTPTVCIPNRAGTSRAHWVRSQQQPGLVGSSAEVYRHRVGYTVSCNDLMSTGLQQQTACVIVILWAVCGSYLFICVSNLSTPVLQ